MSGEPFWTSFHDLLFNGNIYRVTRRRNSLFSNTLVLPGFDALDAAKIDDPKKLDSLKQTLVLRGRHLESAVFDGADLRKADLEGAQLQGASLNTAQLQGASLDHADLQGALLVDAQLQGASLEYAELQGASLNSAQIQGASLNSAQLQGASLKRAQLQGAWFADTGELSVRVQLRTAYDSTIFYGTDLRNAELWRTSFERALLIAVLEDGLKEGAISKDEFAALKAAIMKEVPEGKQREQALKRIEKLNPDIFGPEASQQEMLEKGHVDETAYKKSLAVQLKSVACADDQNAPYVVRGLIANGRILGAGAQAVGLVEAILKPDCPVSATLTDADKAALKEIAEDASRWY